MNDKRKSTASSTHDVSRRRSSHKPVAQVLASSSKPSASEQQLVWTQKRVACSKCGFTLDEPRLFVCLHALCNKCMRQLKPEVRGGTSGYVCPVCSDFSGEEQVRSSFLLSELLDFFQLMNQRGAVTSCKQCRKSQTKLQRCVDCKADFCDDCRRLHDGFELMRVSHRWMTHDDVGKRIIVDKLLFCAQHPKNLAKYNCVDCTQLVCEPCSTNPTEHGSHKCELIDASLQRLLPEVKGFQSDLEASLDVAAGSLSAIKLRAAEICAAAERQAEEARRIHRKLTEVLNASLVQLLNEVEQVKSDVRTQAQELSGAIDIEAKRNERAVTWLDSALHVAQGASLLQELQSGVRDRLQRLAEDDRIRDLPKADTLVDLQVTLLSSAEATAARASSSNQIGTIVHMNVGRAVKKSDAFDVDFEDLYHRNRAVLLWTAQLPAGLSGRRFACINDKLYIPYQVADDNGDVSNMIRVFRVQQRNDMDSSDAETVTEVESEAIKLPVKIGKVHAIVQTRFDVAKLPDTEVAALASDSGLHTINKRGNIVQEISPSSCCDVTISNGVMYALDYAKQVVTSYEFKPSGWQKRDVIDVKFADAGVNDTLQVVGEEVHVARWWGDVIHSYTASGSRRSRYDFAKSGTSKRNNTNKRKSTKSSSKQLAPGISNPRLCGSDVSGAVLFCDSGNRRVQYIGAHESFGTVLLVLTRVGVMPMHVMAQHDNMALVLCSDNTVAMYAFQPSLVSE